MAAYSSFAPAGRQWLCLLTSDWMEWRLRQECTEQFSFVNPVLNAVTGKIKLALAAGKANPAPPVGPALGSKVRSALCGANARVDRRRVLALQGSHNPLGRQGLLWKAGA